MTKTKVSKVWRKSAEHFQEHEFWNFPPIYPGRPGERGLPMEFDAVVASVRSICGGIDDSLPVELYDGTLGVSRDFVARYERPVGQLQWRADLDRRFQDPGNVAGKRWASGILIARDLFLTTSHSFEQPDDQWRLPRREGGNLPISPEEAARHMQVNFNYQLSPNGSLREEESFPVLELLEYRRRGLDFAIVRLGGNPGDTFGFAGISAVDAHERDMLCIIQHPEGQPKRIDAGPLFHLHGDQMGYDAIDTLGGSSGAGILQAATGLLVGLHTNGGCDDRAIGHNYGITISAIIRESRIVQELLRSGWHRQNLSLAGGAPQAKSHPVAQWPVVLYRGHHGTLQMLRRVAERWEGSNLTALTDAVAMRGNPALATENGRIRIFFRGRDRHLHLLNGEKNWQPVNLTNGADMPPVDEDPCVVVTTKGLSVAYLDQRGHLHEMRSRGDRWGRGGSPTQATGAPPAKGGLTGVTREGQYQWCYFDRKKALHRLVWSGQWSHQRLTNGKDHPVLGGPAVWSGTGGIELIYRSRRGRLILLRERDNWRPVNLTKTIDLPPAAGNPRVVTVNGAVFLLYRDRKDQLHLLSPADGPWGHTEVTKEAGTGPAKGDPTGFEMDGRMYLLFRTKDNQLLAVGRA